MTVRIGFSEKEDVVEDVILSEKEKEEQRLKDKTFMEKLHIAKTSVKLRPEREKEFKESFDCICVREFGDDYHLTEEQRIEKNKFYEAFRVFSKCKHKHRKIEEFIKVFREALRCLDIVAKNNGVYDPDEFKEMYFKKKIYVNGLKFPEFRGRERKIISTEYLADFILSGSDPSEIIQKKEETFLSSEGMKDLSTILFTKKELEDILAPRDESETERITRKRLNEDEQNDSFFILKKFNKKENKEFKKNNPEFLMKIKEGRRESRRIERAAEMAYEFSISDMSQIEKYDRKHSISSGKRIPKFKGDITNAKDFDRYMMELDDWMGENVKEDYHGKMKTLDQIQELELKQLLENHNWNIRNLYENKEKRKKLKKLAEKDREREKELRKKLIALTDRRRRRLGQEEDKKEKKKEKKKKSKQGEGSTKLT